MADAPPEIVYKILVIGNSRVGKTCILERYTNDSFTETTMTTVGIDFHTSEVTVDDTPVSLQIWDTAGQERFRTIVSSYYRHAVGIILVYDITNRTSFDQISDWLDDIALNSSEGVVKMLVGNKRDLKYMRLVSESEAAALAEARGMAFMETSAKTGEGVDEVFQRLAELTHAAHAAQCGGQDEPESSDALDIREDPESSEEASEGGGCC
eukprot:gnl/Chilomastix_cuspidata/2593.p1 GENE.gnl/Chilomastix_cuspidata/2593~~gnl/Chilomastix_cuspidata/2593.p1  ORF type:complete len:210 (-),score=73.80 gnl/Chilomastix_cuspidata/2593:291-920(-)